MQQSKHLITLTTTPNYVSVWAKLPTGVPAVAQADGVFMGVVGDWWISRVMVPSAFRGEGLGSRMLGLLLGGIQEVHREDKLFRGVVVTPGGYGVDPRRQRAFYLKIGFKPVIGDEGLLEWTSMVLPSDQPLVQ